MPYLGNFIGDGPEIVPGRDVELDATDWPLNRHESVPTRVDQIAEITRAGGDSGVAFHDTFDRVPINQKWVQWVGAPFYNHPPAVSPDRPGEVRFYAAGSKQEGPHIGVVIRHDTKCSNCHEVVAAGHRYQAVPAADMAGTIHHVDCTDPTLERSAES